MSPAAAKDTLFIYVSLAAAKFRNEETSEVRWRYWNIDQIRVGADLPKDVFCRLQDQRGGQPSQNRDPLCLLGQTQCRYE